MTELAKLTWPEAAGFIGPETVVLLPLGSTEPHGPHLPLDTDVALALAQARRAAELLGEYEVKALILPPISYGITRIAQDFPGGVTLRPGTLWALLEDFVLSLQQDEVRQLVVCNSHLEPEQLRVLRGLAVDYPRREPGRCQFLFPDPPAPTAAGDPPGSECHAGLAESSMMLAVEPESVRVQELRRLPPVEISIADQLARGVGSLRDMGGDEGYCGSPAEANAAAGRESIDRLARAIVDAVRGAWPDLFPTTPGSDRP